MTRLFIFATSVLIAASTCIVPAQSPKTSPAPQNPRPLTGLDSRFIDTTVNPCVDFFQYACGNFNTLYPIPNDRSSYGAGAIVAEHTEEILHTILEAAAAGGIGRSPNEQRIGDFYASCLAADVIDRQGLGPLQTELNRIAGLTSKDQLPEILAHYQLINVTAFFNFGEQQDFENAREQIAAVDQGGLGLPDRDFYLRSGDVAEKTRTEYVHHTTNILKLTGETEVKAAADAQNIMRLETALAKASLDIPSRRNPRNVYHLMPVSQLAALAPSLDWNRFLAATGAPLFSKLNVTSPDFFKGLSAVLVSTDLETVKAYLRWQLIHRTDSLVLPARFDEEIFDFYGRQLSGQPEQSARWRRCVQATDGALGEALGQVYVAREFPLSSKQAAVEMVKDIEAAMNQDIDALTWMSSATKAHAKEKLRSVAEKIGYPEHWRDYSTLSIVRGDAFAKRATRG